jgi:hypothetical protein
MANRNFDSRVIIQRLQNRIYSRNLYNNNTSGQRIINNPQTTDGNASRYVPYHDGAQTEYFRTLSGTTMISPGGIENIPPYPAPPRPAPSPFTVPDAPINLVATPGNTEVTISFTQGSTGGSPITNYEYSIDGGAYVPFSPAVTASPVVITGLVNGTSYSITLKAINAAGPSVASASVSVTPFAFIPTPTLYYNFGDPTSYSGSGTSVTNVGSVTNTGTLTNGPTYNSANGGVLLFKSGLPGDYINGNAEFSSESFTINIWFKSTTNVSVPRMLISKEPRNGSAWNYRIYLNSSSGVLIGDIKTGSSSASIGNAVNLADNSWHLASFSRDATTHTLKLYVDGVSVATPVTDALTSITSNQFVWFGLSDFATTNGSYPFLGRIGSAFIYDRALTSAEVNSNYLATRERFMGSSTVPDAPTSLVATPSDSQVSIAFTQGSDGGSDITNYQYSIDGITFTPFSPADTSSPVVITGLTNGTSYSIELKAVNIVGESVASDPVSATPGIPPSPPTSLVATPGSAQVSVAFTPGSSGTGTITNYQYSTDNGTTFIEFSPADAASPVLITTLSTNGTTPLTNGTLYAIKLKAVTIYGASVASTVVSARPVGPPNPPTSLAATPSNTQLSITFTAGSNGGSAITNYQYSTDDGDTFTAFSPADTSSPVVITGLTPGTTYSVKLKAVNAIGTSDASSAVSATTTTILPDAPVIVSGSPNDQSAIITFTQSGVGAPVTNYEYSTDNGTTFIELSPADTTSPFTITTLSSDGITPLTNGTPYSIQIKAVNAVGTSSASNTVSVTPAPAIDVIIMGDSNVGLVSSSVQSAKTALGYTVPLNITTQQLNGYTGTTLSSFQVAILYTNGGLNLNATLGNNLNTFVANGGHLIMASFCWGNVPAISSFDYNSYSSFQFKGTYSSVNCNTAVYTITHPITTGIPTSTGLGSQNVPNPILLTTTPASQVIATYSGGVSFISTGQNGTARLVGINAYVVGSYSGDFVNTSKYVCNSIYWCKGLI